MLITNSDTVIDLEGKTLNHSIIIRGPIKNVVIRNGTIEGEVRLRPSDMGDSHTQPGHTERIRQESPSNVTVRNITFDTDGSTHQIYFGPGSTDSRVLDCTFKGSSLGSSVYLSPEGGSHIIKGCRFAARTGQRREVLAVDGSRDNLITENTFERCHWGGVYIYRNCGENGTVRHQKPQYNKITGNSFDLTGMRLFRLSNELGHQGESLFVPHAIILGSRQGGSAYCDLDSMYPLGSGLSDLDYAENNVVQGNRFSGDWFRRHIWDNDVNNKVVR